MSLNKNIKSDDYEILVKESDKDSKIIIEILEIVAQFIKDRELILYGGEAIDRLMRLQGSQLYKDHQIPDYDFFSKDSVSDAYDLTEILRNKGYHPTDAIVARHMQTMRVRYNFNYVADISYIPENVYEKMKSMAKNYNGMLIISPYVQFIDQHLSLSKPFSFFPNENMYGRWKKDLNRYNMLYNKYPIEIKDKNKNSIPNFKKDKIHLSINFVDNNNLVIHGFISYAKLYQIFIKIANKTKVPYKKNLVIPLDFSVKDNNMYADCPKSFLPCVLSNRPLDVINKFSDDSLMIYRSYLEFRPVLYKFGGIDMFDVSLDPISINSLSVDGKLLKFSCVQYLLLYFLYYYLFENQEICKYFYLSLIEMINTMEKILDRDLFVISPFCLSTNNYGDNFHDERYYVQQNIDITGESPLPEVYFENNPRPDNYNYNNHIFRHDGTLIQPS